MPKSKDVFFSVAVAAAAEMRTIARLLKKISLFSSFPLPRSHHLVRAPVYDYNAIYHNKRIYETKICESLICL